MNSLKTLSMSITVSEAKKLSQFTEFTVNLLPHEGVQNVRR